MGGDRIRVGVIGAGNNTRTRHIPGLLAIDGVEIVAVANRSRESAQAVCDQFGIPSAHADWRAVVDDDSLDAIVIGTWPDTHRTLTCAALDAGKHVMCEARMAATLADARAMLDSARQRPRLVAQVVPSPFTLRVDQTIKELLGQGYLGELYSLSVVATTAEFANFDAPLHWRHQRRFSGQNIMNMGIWYEATMRWVGPATSVSASARTFVRRRNDPVSGSPVDVDVPDHVQVLTDLSGGALGDYRISTVNGLGPTPGAWLFGSTGTLHFDSSSGALFGGRAGDTELAEIAIPAQRAGGWRVEEEFVNAIRGLEEISHTTFADGVKYMEFTEAVHSSAETGQKVALPLS